MALFDLQGRRMTLRVFWELRNGPLTFRAPVDAAGANPAVLNARLAELRAAGLVAHVAAGYALTDEATALQEPLLAIVHWCEGWSARLGESRGAVRSGRSTRR